MSALLLVQAAFAAQVAFRLDSDVIREGQSVGLDLVVVDTTARGVPEPELPKGLTLEYQHQSRQRQIINFQSTSSTTFSYRLTGVSAGEYVIPPVPVQTEAGVLSTAPLTVRVEPRSAEEATGLVASIGSQVAWVGQVLVYDLRFQTDERVVNGRWSPPDAPGFTVEPSAEPMTAEFTLEQDGKPLSVMELHYPLRASAPGKWTIPAGVLQAQFAVTDARSRRSPASFIDGIGPFGNVRTEVYSSKPIEMEVRALPVEGRPANATDLVGRFAIEAKVSDTAVRVGDTVTVEVVVTGDGPLAGFTLPPLAGEGFRVYDDQPVVEARVEGGAYRARATFKRAIVPVAPGDVQVPAIELAYFDPVAGEWARAATAPIRLEVGGEAATPTVISEGTTGPRTVDAIGEDILPVRTDPSLSRPLPRGLALALLAPGGLALLAQGVRAVGRRRRVEPTDRPVGLDALPADPEGRLALLERVFRERVAARLGVPADALRREDLARLGPLAGEAEELYRALERCRYGDARQAPEDRVRRFLDGLA